MDRERAKELLPFIQALVEGKTIKAYDECVGWVDCKAPDFCMKAECYRIKPEVEVKLMTYRQLAEWCAKGNGEFRFNESSTFYNICTYDEPSENNVVSDVSIRYWNSNEWIKPTLEVYLEDCGKEN